MSATPTARSSYGAVWRALHKTSGHFVAIKILVADDLESMKGEILILKVSPLSHHATG